MPNPIPAFALLAAMAAPASAATIIQHSNAQSLRDTLSVIQIEDFEDSSLLPGFSIGGTAVGNISGGVLYRLVRADRPSVFNFEEPIFGFGGHIRAAGFGQLALTLTFADGTQLVLDNLAVSPAPSFAFFGYSSDTAITSISIRSATAGAVAYYMEDFIYGSAAVVPEPEQWAMMILGFGLIGTAMRHRRRPVVPA